MNGFEWVLELGAGPGRLTKNLLVKYFEKIDMNDIVDFMPEW